MPDHWPDASAVGAADPAASGSVAELPRPEQDLDLRPFKDLQGRA